MIPIVIICHNNHEYVGNMISCIRKINKDYTNNIVLVDNNSTRKETISFLNSIHVKVHFNYSNMGPWISPNNNFHIYKTLPDYFVLTDPDLELNPNMPSDFLDRLLEISNKYPWTSKIGLALDISDSHLFFDGIYTEDRTIHKHESQFWTNPIDDPKYELYRSALDTTFCLVNKKIFDHPNNHIRVAGNFTCKHLPWYKINPILSVYENYTLAKSSSRISTTSKLIIDSLEKDYLCVPKNDQIIMIQNKEKQNLDFWRDKFTTWEPYTFQVFDKFLDPTKTFIDIGGWIGTTCIYASRKSKDVFVIEADPKSYNDLVENCRVNGCKNVTPIHRAVFSESNKQITIVGNNESTSQISFDGSGNSVETISLYALILENKIDPSNISLIKVDIEGAEEYILPDLFRLHKIYNIPLYLSFHYQFFTDKNLDRFEFLTEEQKCIIRDVPFPSIVFDSDNRFHYVA